MQLQCTWPSLQVGMESKTCKIIKTTNITIESIVFWITSMNFRMAHKDTPNSVKNCFLCIIIYLHKRWILGLSLGLYNNRLSSLSITCDCPTRPYCHSFKSAYTSLFLQDHTVIVSSQLILHCSYKTVLS